MCPNLVHMLGSRTYVISSAFRVRSGLGVARWALAGRCFGRVRPRVAHGAHGVMGLGWAGPGHPGLMPSAHQVSSQCGPCRGFLCPGTGLVSSASQDGAALILIEVVGRCTSSTGRCLVPADPSGRSPGS